MNDIENSNSPQEDEEEKKKKKKKKGETESMGSGSVQVSDNFYSYMSSVGATTSQIAEVLRAWRHLKGKGLIQALKDFAGRKSRASAHAEVSIKKDSDYGLMYNFFKKLKSLRNDKKQDLTKDQENHRPEHHEPTNSGPSL